MLYRVGEGACRGLGGSIRIGLLNSKKIISRHHFYSSTFADELEMESIDISLSLSSCFEKPA